MEGVIYIYNKKKVINIDLHIIFEWEKKWYFVNLQLIEELVLEAP